MANIKILNEFGITPTNTYTSAGADFYVPYITTENYFNAFSAFMESFDKSEDELNDLISLLSNNISVTLMNIQQQMINILHLYLSLDSYTLRLCSSEEEKVKVFCNQYLIFDKNGVPGYQLQNEDLIKINSGIRVALESNTAGIFFNKSGKGNNGLDVRACVVDEDYAGFVHLSLQYSKKTVKDEEKIKIYCGDKITQMVILPIVRMNAEEVSPKEYYEIMKDSNRGSNSFGSSDLTH